MLYSCKSYIKEMIWILLPYMDGPVQSPLSPLFGSSAVSCGMAYSSFCNHFTPKRKVAKAALLYRHCQRNRITLISSIFEMYWESWFRYQKSKPMPCGPDPGVNSTFNTTNLNSSSQGTIDIYPLSSHNLYFFLPWLLLIYFI